MSEIRFIVYTDNSIYLLLKRVIDISLSLMSLLLLSPILILISILVKVDSPGPVFFKQKRVGTKILPFYMYKFRTMCVDAEDIKESLLAENEMSGPTFKMSNDPRVTSIGSFLRKHCLDELPQLFNIIAGDMSLVGPRPPTPNELDDYKTWHFLRFNAIPGLTCFWQVENDRTLSFDEWVELDIKYIKERSILLDLKLIIQTIPIVIFGQH